MLEKFKNIFKNIFKSSKTKISFLFLIFLGLVIPKSVSAVIPVIYVVAVGAGLLVTSATAYLTAPKVVERVLDVTASGIFNILFAIIISISDAFLALSQLFLNTVISSNFIPFSFTGTDNVIVQLGWVMVRDFTNMFIVLGFVVIALATILRIKEYHAQKLLPLLIGIALLINFTPVICGFVIDVSNITMNHFLGGAVIGGETWGNLKILTTRFLDNPLAGQCAETFAMGMMLTGFSITAGILYFMFGFLFLFRYIALWILIILSPLAFFCYILPATKSMWNLWWKQFFQWCIIGIPAAFFLWLSKNLILGINEAEKGVSAGDITVVGVILQYSIVLAFLLIGFLVSLQTGAMGASVITKATQGAVKGTAKWAGRKAGAGAKFLGREGMSKVLGTETGEKIREKAENWAMAKTPGTGEKGFWGRATRLGAALPWAAKRKIGKTISPLPEVERKIADQAAEEAKSKDYVGNVNAINSSIDSAANAGRLSTMIDKGQSGDALKSGQINKNQVLSAYRKTIKMKDKDKSEKFERAFVKDYGDEIEKIAFEEGTVTEKDLAEKGYENYQEKIIAGAKKPDELKQLQKGWHKKLKDGEPKLLEYFERSADGGRTAKMCDVGGKDFVDNHQKFVDENGPEWYLRPENFNISMINYHSSPAAASAGLNTMTDDGKKIKTEADVIKYSKGKQESLGQIREARNANIEEATNKAKKIIGEGKTYEELKGSLKGTKNTQDTCKRMIKKAKKDNDAELIIKKEMEFSKLQRQEKQILKEMEKVKLSTIQKIQKYKAKIKEKTKQPVNAMGSATKGNASGDKKGSNGSSKMGSD